MRAQFSKFTESFNSEAIATFADNAEAANERVLAFVIDANRRLADFAVTSADRVAEALPVALPLSDKLPTPTERAERYLDFVERAATMNRDFNQRVLAMITVDAPAVIDRVVEPVVPTTTATKTPAKKARTTKAPAKKASAKRASVTKRPAKRAAAKTTSSSN